MARTEDMNLEDLDLEGLEEIEVEEAPVKEKKAKKEKAPKAPKEPKKKVISNMVGANDVAIMLETNGPNFRSWLRTQYPAHPKGTGWKWEKDSRELQEVIDTFKARQAGLVEKKAAKEVEETKVEEIEIDFE